MGGGAPDSPRPHVTNSPIPAFLHFLNFMRKFSHSRVKIAVAGFALACACAMHAAETFLPFPDGTRWVAVGDSITDIGDYHSYAHVYHLTRFPDRDLTVRNAGISGDTAQGCLRRYAADVAPKHGDIATVMFGMNETHADGLASVEDAALSQANHLKRLDVYEKSVRELVRRLQADGTRPILLTPSIYDDTSAMSSENRPGRNKRLGDYAQRVRDLAAEKGLTLVDFHGPMSEISLRLQKDDPALTIIGKDRVHPMPDGHLLMAYLLLKTLGAPAEVANVEIDGASGAVFKTSNCDATVVEKSPEKIAFDYRAKALPFPQDNSARRAYAWVPFNDELNRETLMVRNLPEGRYALRVDGKHVRDFTAQELAMGVNLVVEKTPQAAQSLEVWKLYRALCRAPIEKLRVIAKVECSVAPDAPPPLTLAQVEPKLAAWLESCAGQPYAPYHAQLAEKYRAYKPTESELNAELENALGLLHAAAKPAPHLVSLERVDPAAR